MKTCERRYGNTLVYDMCVRKEVVLHLTLHGVSASFLSNHEILEIIGRHSSLSDTIGFGLAPSRRGGVVEGGVWQYVVGCHWVAAWVCDGPCLSWPATRSSTPASWLCCYGPMFFQRLWACSSRRLSRSRGRPEYARDVTGCKLVLPPRPPLCSWCPPAFRNMLVRRLPALEVPVAHPYDNARALTVLSASVVR